MKARVDLERLPTCSRMVITIIDSESIHSNNLFKNSLDYPSDNDWFFIENKDNINWIENVFFDEEKARMWADREIKILKDKLNI